MITLSEIKQTMKAIVTTKNSDRIDPVYTQKKSLAARQGNALPSFEL